MYELKRVKEIHEQLKIGDEVLDIVIRPEEIVREYNTAVADIVEAQRAVNAAKKTNKEDAGIAAIEQYGKALVQIMVVLLGEENTQKITAYYDNNVVEMGVEITPYLTGVIGPQIAKAAEIMRMSARANFRAAGRKSRLFKR